MSRLEESNIYYPYSINGRWGVVDSFCNIILEPKYDEIGIYKYGMAKYKYNNKIGYINPLGKIVIHAKYLSGSDFYYNCAQVSDDKKQFYIDRKGHISNFENCKELKLTRGCAAGHEPIDISRFLLRKNGLTAIISESTRDTSIYYYDTVYRFNEYFHVVEKNGKFGFIDKSNPYSWHFEKTYSESISRYNYDDVIVQFNKWKYDEKKEYFFSDYAIVNRNGKWGLIYGGSGKIVELITPKYYSINYDVYTKAIKVEYRPNCFGYVTKNGRELFPH